MNKLKVFLLMVLVMFFSSYAIAESADSISTGKLLRYAKRLRYGINTDVDMQRAAKVYGYLAKRGNVVAQRELGRMFLRGEGVQRNSKAARLWLNKACLANDAKAMCIMADIYQYGLGVKTNKSLAFKLYLQAARMGNSQGCFGAGSMLYKGQGVKQDYQKAKEFLQKGSEMGNAKCDFLLANYYAYGYCGTPDYSKAKEFLNRAVQNGHGWTVDMTLFNKLDSVMTQNNVAPKPVLAIAKDKSIRIPVEHPADVVGFWKGTMAVYDWGKTRVLSKEPIMLEVTQDTSLVVTCFQNDSVVSVFRSDRQIDNLWKKEHIGRADKIFKWIPLSVLFEKSADTYTLYAHLNRLSINKRSALKPVVLTLQREESTTNIHNVLSDEKVQVSTLSLQNNIAFTLNVTSATDVNVSVYNLAGMRVLDFGTCHLSSGANNLSFRKSLSEGEYILKVEGKRVHETLKLLICKN